MIFAFTNSKGGVGKSTLSVHLAVWLKERSDSVALIDSDVQGSSSGWFSGGFSGGRPAPCEFST